MAVSTLTFRPCGSAIGRIGCRVKIGEEISPCTRQAGHVSVSAGIEITKTKGVPNVPSSNPRVLDQPDDWLRSGIGSRSDRGRTPDAPHATDPRSEHARLCHGERII